MIEIDQVYKAFGAQSVLNGVALRVDAGETVAILGRSGSGKSVLLKCLVGLLRPDRGTIRIDGQEVTALSAAQLDQLRRQIGYVFQNAALYDSMTVEENLAFHLTRHQRVAPDRLRQIIYEKLQTVGVEAALHKYPSELSGGMQKRVGIARALVLEPKIILYDEPTSGLDPITSREIEDLMIELKKRMGVTSLVITHSLQSARRISDRIAVLYQGQIVAFGRFDEIAQSEHPFVQEYLAAVNLEG